MIPTLTHVDSDCGNIPTPKWEMDGNGYMDHEATISCHSTPREAHVNISA